MSKIINRISNILIIFAMVVCAIVAIAFAVYMAKNPIVDAGFNSTMVVLPVVAFFLLVQEGFLAAILIFKNVIYKIVAKKRAKSQSVKQDAKQYA